MQIQFQIKKRVVLMYREKSEESHYSNDYMFVDLDQSSGGYPTRATMLDAHTFQSVEQAGKYDSKNEFIIAELNIMGTVTYDQRQDDIRKITNKELREKEERRYTYETLKKEFG